MFQGEKTIVKVYELIIINLNEVQLWADSLPQDEIDKGDRSRFLVK
jgi:hypothetical protein